VPQAAVAGDARPGGRGDDHLARLVGPVARRQVLVDAVRPGQHHERTSLLGQVVEVDEVVEDHRPGKERRLRVGHDPLVEMPLDVLPGQARIGHPEHGGVDLHLRPQHGPSHRQARLEPQQLVEEHRVLVEKVAHEQAAEAAALARPLTLQLRRLEFVGRTPEPLQQLARNQPLPDQVPLVLQAPDLFRRRVHLDRPLPAFVAVADPVVERVAPGRRRSV
jgi:hypothetical protein